MKSAFAFLCLLTVSHSSWADDGNRLTYLDENNPYYVSRSFPKLTTPMWIGEDGVDAVVILAIDDMRDPEKYEAFLRPILERLKKIDGRAPVSIMTNQVAPRHPQLQAWLREGLSLEIHTIDHPCPCLAKGSLPKAKLTYDDCVDLMNQIPNNRPVAFRMPCCDSLNTVSPRFFSEVFNRTTRQGKYLTMDSSVFNLLSPNDPDLPRTLVVGPAGSDRFRRYLPTDRSFVNTIENYPYPYVINRLCWEMPCAVPSDWEAQHLQRANNPQTVADWQAVLDATVVKQGVMCLVFHPHNWIQNKQVVELIDHAVGSHGKKVKFLNFKEAQERLDRHLLGGQSLRRSDGSDNGVKLLDLDNDGFIDVVIGNERMQQTRRWDPQERRWNVSSFPTKLADQGNEMGVRFGVIRSDGHASMLLQNHKEKGAWHFDKNEWVADATLLHGVDLPWQTSSKGIDRGVRLRDLDGDGCCELIFGHPDLNAIYQWQSKEKMWSRAPFQLPDSVTLVDKAGRDQGVRFVDVNEDGFVDLLVSNEKRSSLQLFKNKQAGWAPQSVVAARGQKGELPLITLLGSDRGAWFHSRSLWVQNEDTAQLKDHVDRRSFNEMLGQGEPTSRSPEASRQSIQMRPGFVAEIMVAEPLVQDPIAFAWGADGKLWVVEMGDYPLGMNGKGKAGGKIKYLEDTKGTGKYDKATVFLDELPFPTGVLPWKKGVLVTCAPEIFYAEDTDGDGKADKRETLYQGFVQGNQQHRVNGLVRGLDNWIYGANGESGGRIRSLKTGQEADISGRDFRIRPETGEIEAQTGPTQYGRCFDDWGNAFGCNNSNPAYHFVLDDHYLRRNPELAAPTLRLNVSTPPGAAPVFPISRTLPRFNELSQANHVTSACGLTIYRDELFGPSFTGNLFVSEPVHNLVHREVISPHGVSFQSRRALDEQRSEFLASSDNWFRPTTLATGPDGALWIADMYRAVIEHPDWIPPDWQKRLDLRAGWDQGRIYRAYPVGTTPRPIPRMDRESDLELVAALESPSGWQRDMAQQLLIERRATSAVNALEKLASSSLRPQTRLQALCTLDGLQSLSASLLKMSLQDKHPGVRRHAIRLCEKRLNQDMTLGESLAKMIHDLDEQVIMQLAYSLGYWSSPQAAKALTKLAIRAVSDPYQSAAVLSSLHKNNYDQVLLTLLKDQSAQMNLDQYLHLLPALGKPETLPEVLRIIASHHTQSKDRTLVMMTALLDALDRKGKALSSLNEANLKAAILELEPIFKTARATLSRDDVNPADRIAAVRILGRGPSQSLEDVSILVEELHPRQPDEVQLAIISTLSQLQDRRIPSLILARWRSLSPKVRGAVIDSLLQRDGGPASLVTALETKLLQATELAPIQRMQLLQQKNSELRSKAMTLLGSTANANRQKVLDRFRGVLSMTGDANRGSPVFAKHCATCHRLNNVGHSVGPDLASLGDKSPESLLIAMLDPNRAVEARYVNYVAVTKTGRTVTGILGQETSTSITLVGPEGKSETLLRTDVDELATTGKSAMPEGLESELKAQDFADVIAHVRDLSPSPKRKIFAGNQPERIRPDANGHLLLAASKAEIYGPTLTWEPHYGNLGYWQSANDHAVWEVDVPKAGKFEVHLHWACPMTEAGNVFSVQAGLQQLLGQVQSTGSWDIYRQTKVGEINLDAGQQRLVFRPEGKFKGCLLDLKSMRLIPVMPAK